MNKPAPKTLILCLLLSALLLFTACRTADGGRAQSDRLSVAEVHRILYGNDFYEHEPVPRNLQFNPGKSEKEFVLYVLNTYSRDGFYIVYTFMNIMKAKRDFMEWADTETKLTLLESIPRIVHECNHGLNSCLIFTILEQNNIDPLHQAFLYKKWEYEPGKLATEYKRPEIFYIKKRDIIIVPLTDCFHVKEIDPYYPAYIKQLKEFDLMRYPVYVYPMPEFMRDSFYNIYFFLDEFNAYYHTFRTVLDLEEYYKTALPQTAENWLSYFGMVYAYYHAYAEFRLFILTYLLVAKDHYPEDYKFVMANTQFKKAFGVIDRNFSALIDDFFKRRQKLTITWLTAHNLSVKETDTSFFVYKGKDSGGASGFTHIKRGYHILLKEMEKQKYQAILGELTR